MHYYGRQKSRIFTILIQSKSGRVGSILISKWEISARILGNLVFTFENSILSV